MFLGVVICILFLQIFGNILGVCIVSLVKQSDLSRTSC